MLKSIGVASFGNLLEWYDFGLFSSFALLFAHLFFPDSAPNIALIKIFGIYALGFVCRPLGSILFGLMGDRYGRVKTLRTSIFVMSLPTFLVAFLPTYGMLGIGAPIMLIILRLTQGISLGGEFTGVIIYLTESAPKQHRAFFASFAGSIANIGFLLAGIVAGGLSYCLSPSHFANYGWRLAFLLGGVMGLFVFYIQKHLLETKAFTILQKTQHLTNFSFRSVIKKTWPKMLLTMSLAMLGAVLYYLCFVYFFSLLQELGMSKSQALFLHSGSLLLMLILVPLGGMCCDYWGRRTSFLILAGSLFILAFPALWLLLSGKIALIILGLFIFVLLSSLEQGTTSATLVELFPVALRYSSLSFSYNVTQALFGGTAPMLAGYFSLVRHSLWAPALYLMGLALITFNASWFFLKDSRCKKF